MPKAVPIDITEALANIHLADTNPPILSTNNRRAGRRHDQTLPLFPTSVYPQLYRGEGRRASFGRKPLLAMQRLPPNWEWVRGAPPPAPRDQFIHHHLPEPPFRQPLSRPALPTTPSTWRSAAPPPNFTNEQLAVYQQPPSVHNFGHIDHPAQPTTLRLLVGDLQAKFAHRTAGATVFFSTLLVGAWSFFWLFATYFVVAPVLGVYRIVRTARVEMLLGLWVANWLVGFLPKFEGWEGIAAGAGAGAGAGALETDLGGEEFQTYTIYLPNRQSFGGTGPVFPG